MNIFSYLNEIIIKKFCGLKMTSARTGNADETVDMNDTEQEILFEENNKNFHLRNFRRSVKRSGHCALQKKRRIDIFAYFVVDIFTTLVDLRWRFILLTYTLSFLVSWLIFGVLWWIIAYAHGDLHSKDSTEEPLTAPCITEMHDFVSSFLFSLETQYTTGYGTRAPTTECPEAIFLLCVQSIFGVLLQAIMVGAVFAKISRPKTRGHTIIFSKKAVICLRDGDLCLMFRMGDIRSSNVVHCKIHAWLLRDRISKEGELLPHFMKQLKVSVDDGGSSLFLLWPVTVVHKIDSSSPLYDLNPHELLNANMEIVARLVCTSETTGQTTEVRASYAARDILWGHRFKPLLHRDSTCDLIDFENFEKTRAVNTVLCSARQLQTWTKVAPEHEEDIKSIPTDIPYSK